MISSNTVFVSNSQLSDRIRSARLARALTRAELAHRVGVVLSAVSQWEHPNGTSPSVSNLILIAQITDVAFEWLATGRGPTRLTHAVETSAFPKEAIAMDLFEEEILSIARRVPYPQREPLLKYLRIACPSN